MKKLLYLIAIVSLLAACKSSENKTTSPQKNVTGQFDYGSIEDNIYQNRFFGLSLTLPDSWVVQTQETLQKMNEAGKELIAGDDENLKQALDANQVTTVNLLGVFQHDVGVSANFNPSFMLVAENMSRFPNIKSGSDYLFQTRKFLKQSQLTYSYMDDEFKKTTIGKKEFYTMKTIISIGNGEVTQVYYSTILNGFCLSAVISYINDTQKTKLENIIHSMKFN